MKSTPMHAMTGIENMLERALRQLQQIQEQQRAIDVVYMMQEQDSSAGGGRSALPLHVMAKLDRAVGFGLQARSAMTLMDSKDEVLAKSVFPITDSKELSAALLKMSDDDAVKFDQQLTDFLAMQRENLQGGKGSSKAGSVQGSRPGKAGTGVRGANTSLPSRARTSGVQTRLSPPNAPPFRSSRRCR